MAGLLTRFLVEALEEALVFGFFFVFLCLLVVGGVGGERLCFIAGRFGLKWVMFEEAGHGIDETRT